ncbi:MAG: phenylalanine--tRNA ligase subunit beta, partial [Symbiobacteriaceae bacterium]|nr:phenylalanine--tRNA ligase subunit beta [Symbiobacteriaceae bacterium]
MQVLLPWLQEFLPELAIDAKAALDIVARLTASGIECEEPQELAPGVIAIELDLTPNRSDCLSLLGVAREIGALYNLALTYQEAPPLPVRVAPEVITIAAGESCPYYLGLIIDKVQVAPSPLWLQEKLEASGMRPINNVVDLANLVMLELGEPLHTFDYDRLAGGGIHVRYAAPEEEITTLDGVQRRLNRDTLLICDKVKPVAIAGVMGDALSEVTPATQRLLIEAACFERRSIRRTSKEQGLRSEAAIRFEKGVDPAILKKALERYAQLAVSLDLGTPQGKILSATIYGPEATRTILLRHKRLWSITGLPEDNNKAAAMLQRLGFTLTSQDKGWLVTVPTTRQDLHAEIDLIEEVARLIGFAELEAKLPWGVTTPAFYTSRQQALRQIRLCLIRCGLREIVNYSFLHADHR